ncbi:GNAT family N-acetyltransferase [Kitasatospora sp. NPDC059571]|uniref:GNAT family N-acetyltransferase n=1 Tax=Kitasatospora sp. NPDC059571 TaxID=3346871 RepID=UPI0036803183
MDTRSRLELANDNAAAFWLAQARVHGWETVRRPAFTAVRCEGVEADGHRVVVTRPYDRPEELTGEVLDVLRGWRTARLCLEDPYGRLDLGRHGCVAALGQAVMTREAAPAVHCSDAPSARRGGARSGATGETGATGVRGGEGRGAGGAVSDGEGSEGGDCGDGGDCDGGIEVRASLGPDDLAEAEAVLIGGLPLPGMLPHVRGALIPPALLGAPGYRVWTARRNGMPAGACVSYDDGTALGLYMVATLPEHRSRGVGRAVVAAALDAHPDRVAVLVATLLGEPLYRRMGFVEQGVSRWWALR